MNEEQLEKRSLEDLGTILRAAQRLAIKLVIIGGYAVSSYSHAYRYTKDIDLVADKPTVGKLRGLLKRLGYAVRDTEFGLAGSKRINQEFIDLHISVGRIFDVSTGEEYPVDSTFFRSTRRMKIKGHYEASSLRAAVVDVQTLLILKLVTIGRQKDQVDLISLLLDMRNEIDPGIVAKKAEAAGLSHHLLNRVREYAEGLRKGNLEKIWFDATGVRLLHADKRGMQKFLGKLAEFLRQS